MHQGTGLCSLTPFIRGIVFWYWFGSGRSRLPSLWRGAKALPRIAFRSLLGNMMPNLSGAELHAILHAVSHQLPAHVLTLCSLLGKTSPRREGPHLNCGGLWLDDLRQRRTEAVLAVGIARQTEAKHPCLGFPTSALDSGSGFLSPKSGLGNTISHALATPVKNQIILMANISMSSRSMTLATIVFDSTPWTPQRAMLTAHGRSSKIAS